MKTENTGAGHRRPLNVLYIEDDLAIGLLMKMAVEKHGDRAEIALTGKEGLRLHRTGLYDIVAIDFQLPDMTGIDIGRQILLETPDMPLIMITGRGNERLASEALKLGFVEYLVKDDADVFLELVPSIIEHCWRRHVETDRLRSTQDLLSEVTDRFEGLIRLSPDGIMVVSDGMIAYANPAMDGVFGDRLAADLLETELSSVVHPDIETQIMDVVDRVIDQRIPRETIQIQNNLENGETRYLNISAGYCEFAGEPAAQMVVHDVTADKLIAEELRQARDAADLANRTKTEFLSSMSHELRTPMNAILGFSQILLLDKAQPISDRQRQNVEHILQGGEHLLSLINDLLDLAKIESGSLQIDGQSHDLIPLIDEAVDMTSPSPESRGITISRNYLHSSESNTAAFQALVDSTRFKQIIVNLMSNAVKYNTEKGRIDIAVNTPAPDTVRVSIQDTGNGIPEEMADCLFEPFNRLNAEGSSIEGTGIGLPITKKLIELMGGTVGYESVVGQGSTFWVDVPKG